MTRLCLVACLFVNLLFANSGSVFAQELVNESFSAAEQRLAVKLLDDALTHGSSDNVVVCPFGVFHSIGVIEPAVAGRTAELLRTILGADATQSSEALADDIESMRRLGNPIGFEFGASLEDNQKYGVRLTTVAPDSPAAAAGLRPGDLVFTVDGAPVRSRDEFRQSLMDSTGRVQLTGYSYESGREFTGKLVRLQKKQLVSSKPEDQILTSTTAICLQKDLFHESKYPSIVCRLYDVECLSGDFARPESFTTEIVRVFGMATGNRASRFEFPQRFDSGTRLWLANAVTFDAKWVTPLSTAKGDKLPPFASPNGPVPVAYLNRTSMSLKFAELPDVGAAVIELPYERTSLVMRVYLPKSPRGWQMLRASDWLLPERSRELRSKFKQRAVELLIPKFQIASKVSLRNALTESGLGDLFTNRADFSKISRDPLMLSNIRQQTFIEIDEIGTRAGALTEAELITAGVAPDPVRFFVTHPFFYTIVDPVSGVVFFAGRVTCPPVLQPEPPRERMILE